MATKTSKRYTPQTKPHRFDDADRAGMAAMKAAGKKITAIARRFCCSYPTVQYHLAQHKAMQRARIAAQIAQDADMRDILDQQLRERAA